MLEIVSIPVYAIIPTAIPVAPGRGDAELDIGDQDVGAEDEHNPDHHQHSLGEQVADREDQVERRGLLRPLDVEGGESGDQDDPADHVARPLAQRLPEDGQVVRHEEGRDRDRDDVVQHLPPGCDEAGELVERVASEVGGAAGLRVHHGPLDVGRGRADEDHPGNYEGNGRQAQRERGGDAKRVVGRRADIPVGSGEQRLRVVHPRKRLVPRNPSGQGPEYTPGSGASCGR
jgi:hypothetical protein